mgnify:CR=1 FL=1
MKCAETAIELCFRLKQDVGSYALMGGTGFAHTDFLQCCKFAEGDSRILMQKMARDRMAKFARGAKGGGGPGEEEACLALATALQSAKGSRMERWDANWRLVYDLAERIMDGVLQEWGGGKAKL